MTIVRVDERSSVQIISTGPANHAIRGMGGQGVVGVPSSGLRVSNRRMWFSRFRKQENPGLSSVGNDKPRSPH